VRAQRRFRIKYSTLLLVLSLPALAMVDVAFGAMVTLLGNAPLSPSVLLRGALVFAIMTFALRRSVRVGPMASTLIYVTLLSTLPALAVSMFSGSQVLGDLSHAIKAIYMPLLLGFLTYIIQHYRIAEDDVLRFVEYWSYVMTLGFVVPNALGIGAQTYGDYAAGTKGFFVAGNDASLALGLSLFVVCYRLFFVKFSILGFLMYLLGIYALVSVGSRTSLILLAGSGLFLFLGMLFFHSRFRHQSLVATLSRCLASFAFLGAIAYAISFGIAMQSENSYQQEKLQQLIIGESPRELLVLTSSSYLESREAWKTLTGEGQFLYEVGVGEHWGRESRKIAEVDWLDAFGIYGAPYTTAIYLLIIPLLL